MRRIFLIGASCAAILVGCGDKSAMPDDVAASVAAIDIEGVSGKDIAKRFETAPRTVSAADAEAALKRIQLWESSDTIRWESREGEAGNYVFTNITVTVEESGPPVLVERAEFNGLHLNDGRVGVDSAKLTGLKVVDDETQMDVAEALWVGVDLGDIDTIMAEQDIDESTRIPKARATAFTDIRLTTRTPSSTGAVEWSDEDIERLLSPEGLDEDTLPEDNTPEGEDREGDVTDYETVTATLASVAWAAATSVEARDGFFDMDDLDVAFTTDGDANHFKIETAYARGIVAFQPIFDAAQARARGETLDAGVNPFPKEIMLQPLQGLGMTGFDLHSPEIIMAIDQVIYESAKRGNRLTGESRFDGFTLSPGTNDDPTQKGFARALADFGYDALSFSGTGSSHLDLKNDRLKSESSMVMEDGFEMDLDIDYNGAVAMAELYSDMFNQIMRSDGNMDAMATRFGMAQMGLIDALRVNGLRLRFDDNSIMERTLKFAAQEENTTPEEILAEMLSGLDELANMPAPGGVDAQIQAQTVAAFREFLTTPGSAIEISINPKEPMTIFGFIGADTERMGFSAKTSP